MKKIKFLLIILVIYAIAYICGYFLTTLFNIESLIINVLVFDLIATVIVYIFSVIFKNSSVYDPYWSVLPGIVAIYLMIHYHAYTVYHFIFLAAFLVWAFRLTINWMTETSGFDYEDWRYRHFRSISKNKLEWFVYNFFGIHIVPTLFVFFGMLPLFDIFALPELNIFTIIGSLVILTGVAFEHFADTSMRSFLQNKNTGVCHVGLWKYSRHPNYLGEMTIWTGVFISMIVNIQTNLWYAVGFLGIIFMFNVISIPLAENNLKSKIEEYNDYQHHVSRFLILPNRK